MKRILCSILIVVLASGCTTMAPVDVPRNHLGSVIQVGDTVAAVTKDGRPHTFEVRSVSPESLCGPEQCFDTADLVRVERSEVSAGKVVAGVLLVVLAVALVAATRRISPGFPPAP